MVHSCLCTIVSSANTSGFTRLALGLGMALLIFIFSLSVAPSAYALCGTSCGDANGSGVVTSADIILLVGYLYDAGPPPSEPECADCDDFELITIRDVQLLVNFIFKGGPVPNCPVTNSPYVPTPTTDIIIDYNNVFPAGVTSHTVTLELTVITPELTGLTVPVLILVGGAPPTVDAVNTLSGAGWSLKSATIEPALGPSGSIIMGFMIFSDPVVPGIYDLAEIELSMPLSGTPRPITISYVDLPPLESGQFVNYPMAIEEDLDGFVPQLGPVPPGGTGSISGIKYYDDNANCLFDGTDVPMSGWLILATSGTNTYVDMTDGTGSYSIVNLPNATYTVTEVLKPGWTQTCPIAPPSYTVITTGVDEPGKDFGNFAPGGSPDLVVTVAGGRALRGWPKRLAVGWENSGTAPVAATLVLTLDPDPLVTYNSSSPGGVFNGGSKDVTWNLGTLAPGDRGIERVRIDIDASLTLGNIITSIGDITPVVGDLNPLNNTFTESEVVIGSYDPNEKHVTPDPSGPSPWIMVDDTLAYHVDFQNTGTAEALLVVVRDTLDINLDMAKFIPGPSSHPYVFSASGREIAFTFSGINLPDSLSDEPGSHGFVEYTIIPKVATPAGTLIPNTAGIYFDFNPPVITNTVTNQICPVEITGDVNVTGVITSADIIYLVNFVFKSAAAPLPVSESGDVDCSGAITSGDIIYMVNHVFKGGPEPCNICTDL